MALAVKFRVAEGLNGGWTRSTKTRYWSKEVLWMFERSYRTGRFLRSARLQIRLSFAHFGWSRSGSRWLPYFEPCLCGSNFVPAAKKHSTKEIKRNMYASHAGKVIHAAFICVLYKKEKHMHSFHERHSRGLYMGGTHVTPHSFDHHVRGWGRW